MALLEVNELSTDIFLSSSVVHALDKVSFTVEEGETLGIVGESGSGKTMTAMSIERLLPPGGRIVGGSIRFDGADLVTMSDTDLRKVRGGDIGMIFQDPMTSLNPLHTVGTLIAEPLLLHRGVKKSVARERVLEMLDLVGIPNPTQRIDDYPHQLSGGQRQRVMIAMALICRPKLLIADEPTTALDVTVQKQILELIDRLRDEFRMAMILVTHDLGVIAGSADRVAVMYAGKIAEVSGTETLFRSPKHRYTEALFEALPERAVDTGTKLYSIPGLPPDLTESLVGCRFSPRCRFVTDRCRVELPEFATIERSDGAQEYACFVPRADPDERSRSLSVVPRMPEVGDDPPRPATPGGNAAQSANTALVSANNLVKDFPITAGLLRRTRNHHISAVAGVDLVIQKGQTVGLVGESGCGKTTLGRLLVGLEKPTSGTVYFQGRKVQMLRGADAREGRRSVQFMFQDSYASLDPRMRVRSILREPLQIQGIGTNQARNVTVDELLDAVGLPRSAAQRYPHEFSGGQRQRIGLARALALHPALIVADEPVSALDVSIQAQMLNLMKELQRERGLSYLFISHDLSVVRYLSDIIAVMYLGKIVEIGPAARIYGNPRHHYTRGLIDTIPVADPLAEKAKAKLGVRGELPSAISPPSGCRFRTRCPAAEALCAEIEPVLRILPTRVEGADSGVGDHRVACHFPLAEGSLGYASGIDSKDDARV